MDVFPNVLAMIGNTPMVEVTRLDTGPCRLLLKLENQNPRWFDQGSYWLVYD